MLFPINCYFRYASVALHYLTVRDGSWWTNLFLHWFQPLRSFDWCICVNVETRGPAHLRKIACSHACSCGWSSWTVLGKYSWLIFSTTYSPEMLDILSHWGPSGWVPCCQWGTIVDTWDRWQCHCNCGLISPQNIPLSLVQCGSGTFAVVLGRP